VGIKVNLLPREARPSKPAITISAPKLGVGAGLVSQIFTGILVLVLLGLAGMGYSAWNAKTSYAREITELKARNDALKVQLSELRQAEEAKREIQRRIEVIGKVAKSQGVPLAVLNGVLKAVPQGIWLSTMEMKPQETRVKVEGRGATALASNETLGRLEAKKAEVAAAAPAAPAGAPREVLQLTGYNLVIKGSAFNNFQIADFMDNLRRVGTFADVDFTVTQADRIEQTRVMNFEVTASVKL
jgi:Tfp pilus assembly protein PilN